MSASKLSRDFYERPNVVQVAKELLGKTLHSCIDGHYTAARITEVEAYPDRDLNLLELELPGHLKGVFFISIDSFFRLALMPAKRR